MATTYYTILIQGEEAAAKYCMNTSPTLLSKKRTNMIVDSIDIYKENLQILLEILQNNMAFLFKERKFSSGISSMPEDRLNIWPFRSFPK